MKKVQAVLAICTLMSISTVAVSNPLLVDGNVWSTNCDDINSPGFSVRSWGMANNQLYLFVLTKGTLLAKVTGTQGNGDRVTFEYGDANTIEEYKTINSQLVLQQRTTNGKATFMNGVNTQTNKPAIPLSLCAQNSQATLAIKDSYKKLLASQQPAQQPPQASQSIPQPQNTKNNDNALAAKFAMCAGSFQYMASTWPNGSIQEKNFINKAKAFNQKGKEYGDNISGEMTAIFNMYKNKQNKQGLVPTQDEAISVIKGCNDWGQKYGVN